MAKAEFRQSASLKSALEEWGLSGEFRAALQVVKSGEFDLNESISFPLFEGMYVAIMNDDRIAIGSTPEITAQQAQYASAPDPKRH